MMFGVVALGSVHGKARHERRGQSLICTGLERLLQDLELPCQEAKPEYR